MIIRLRFRNFYFRKSRVLVPVNDGNLLPMNENQVIEFRATMDGESDDVALT